MESCSICGANLALVGRVHRCGVVRNLGLEALISEVSDRLRQVTKTARTPEPVAPPAPVTEIRPVTKNTVTKNTVTKITAVTKKRGRPSTGSAVPAAERMRRLRARKRGGV